VCAFHGGRAYHSLPASVTRKREIEKVVSELVAAACVPSRIQAGSMRCEGQTPRWENLLALDGFESFPFLEAGATRDVYRRGTGPGVVVMHEIPGITPEVAAFATRVADEGFTVYLPHLFGTPGRPLGPGYLVGQMLRACISREFSVLAKRESSPITHWLRALCRRAHEECGGPGVGAIGMCLTGNFALSLMVDPWVMAPVLSQPSMPFGVSKDHRAALHLSDKDLDTVRKRSQEGAGVLGLRFTHDPMCPPERFETLRRELGSGFEGIEIDSSPGNADKIPRMAHSVVTNDLVDEVGHPTRVALDSVLAMFRERLLPSA
jgi:dienelactone hydrolase